MRLSILWVHQYAWASWFHAQSAPFSISGITNLQHTNTPEYPGFIPSQRRFLLPPLQIFSIQMHLNIPFLFKVSPIFHFWNYKLSASHAEENIYPSRLVYLISVYTIQSFFSSQMRYPSRLFTPGWWFCPSRLSYLGQLLHSGQMIYSS